MKQLLNDVAEVELLGIQFADIYREVHPWRHCGKPVYVDVRNLYDRSAWIVVHRCSSALQI